MKKLILAVCLIVISSYVNGVIPTVAAAERHSSKHATKHHHHRSIASWYGSKFHGKKTASGERFNMYAMTAASRTLPLLSYVEVTNLKNNRSVVVRINDRGSLPRGRTLDLSYAAAKELGIRGTGSVKITPLGRHRG